MQENNVKKIVPGENSQVSVERKNKIISEAGEVLWCLAAICTDLGVSLETVVSGNLLKLVDRQQNNILHEDARGSEPE